MTAEDLVAQTILQGFDAQYGRFLEITSGAQYRFAQAPRPLSRTFVIQSDLPALLQDILSRLPLRLPWQNKSRDIQFICQTLYAQFSHEELQNAVFHIANELFYRNKAAWMIGKIAINNQFIPLLLPIHNIEQHLVIDTCLTTTDEASIVFGFARSYFMVYAPFPAALVTWLRDILPEKSIAELYMSIGCQKHGKTEYYREYLAFMNFSSEQFIEAPGVKGMVMLVFTLPTYDRVFKVIKDRFAPQKTMTAERVKECYRLVKEHDRVGRMADTQEFENFVIDKKRISNDLMAILEQEIPNKLEDLGDKLLISHLYMERRMTPLNIYMEQCDNKQLKAVVEDYGQALKELIAANIFPGDMLFKNFGVTRHHRVIFYDYDEISYMTDMNFRAIPPARYPEDELASEPWYSVAENDVFPEEFRYFLCCDKQVCHYFEAQHRDLLSPEYWQQQQQRIKQGYIEDVYAYPQSKRFIDNDIC